MSVLSALLLALSLTGANAADSPDHNKVAADVRGFLAEIDQDDIGTNIMGLAHLQHAIMEGRASAVQYSTTNGITDDDALWGQIVDHFTARFDKLEKLPEDENTRKFRADIVRLLAEDSHEPASKIFLLKVLDRGPDYLRMQIVWGMRSKNGLHGDDVYQKIKELCDKGVIPEKYRGVALSNADRERGLDELLHVLETTQDKMTFINSGMLYQMNYHSTEHFDLLLRRIKELKLGGPVEKFSDGVFWVDRKLLAKFVDVAKGDDLKNALDVMGMNVGLIDPHTDSIMPLIKCLSNSDSGIRRLAAARLGEAADFSELDHDLLVNSLDIAEKKEVDPGTKTVMAKSLVLAKGARERNIEDKKRHSSRTQRQP